MFREEKQFYSCSGVPKETRGLFLPSFSHKSPFELFLKSSNGDLNGFKKRMRRVRHRSGRWTLCASLSTWQASDVPWLQGSWNYIETNTPFAVDPRGKRFSIFGMGRSACLMRDLFTSEHLWVNLVILNELLNLKIDKKHLQKRHCISRRDSEPSGIPVRTLKSLRNKSRKVREFVFKCIRSSTCKSSNMHCYIKVTYA